MSLFNTVFSDTCVAKVTDPRLCDAAVQQVHAAEAPIGAPLMLALCGSCHRPPVPGTGVSGPRPIRQPPQGRVPQASVYNRLPRPPRAEGRSSRPQPLRGTVATRTAGLGHGVRRAQRGGTVRVEAPRQATGPAPPGGGLRHTAYTRQPVPGAHGVALSLRAGCPCRQGASIRCGLAPCARCHPPGVRAAPGGGHPRPHRRPGRRAPPAGVRSPGPIPPLHLRATARRATSAQRWAPSGQGASGGLVPEAPSRAGAASPTPPGAGKRRRIRRPSPRGLVLRAGFAVRPGPLHWHHASGTRRRSSQVPRPSTPRCSPPWTGWPRSGGRGPRAPAAQQVHSAEPRYARSADASVRRLVLATAPAASLRISNYP